MNEEWVNKNMSIREASIWLMFLEYECPKDKIEELYGQADKRYGNNLTEEQKFEYVSHILQKAKSKQSIRDGVTLKVFNPIIGEVIIK